MARHKNADWNLPEKLMDYPQVNAAVLMDILDKLQRLNKTFNCPNFQNIPGVLKGIRAKLPTRRKKHKSKGERKNGRK